MSISPSTTAGEAPAAPPSDPPPQGSRRRRIAPALLLLLPFAAVLACFWPGHMSADSLEAFRQAREGGLTNQHSPLLNALWGVGWDLFDAGPGWILALQVAGFLAGAYLLLRGLVRVLPAALLTCALAVFPAVFGMLGYVSRDVWFTSGVLLTFGLVSLAGRSSGRGRSVALAAALVLAFLTVLTRQNAAPAVWPACILMAALVLPAWRSRRGRPAATPRRGLIAATAAGTALTIALLALQLAAVAPLDVIDNSPEQQLYAYDLAALSEQDGENLFPPSVIPDQSMAPVDARWNVDTVGPFVFPPDPAFTWPLPEDSGEDLSEAWRDAIVDDPVGYVDERTDLFLRQLALTRRAVWVYHPVIDANGYGLTIRFPELNDAAKDYVEAFAVRPTLDGGVIHAIWIYLLVCVVACLVLLRRSRSWALLVLGAAAFGAIAYQSGLYFGAMATQFRWEWPVLVIGLLCLPAIVAAVRERKRA